MCLTPNGVSPADTGNQKQQLFSCFYYFLAEIEIQVSKLVLKAPEVDLS